DALVSLLIAQGLDPKRLPSRLDDRAALWRGLLADKRILLVLDNAASSDQVAPLLPNASGCLVLVTSRRRLSALDAVPLLLDVLPPRQAEQMFVRLAPQAAGHPEVAYLVRLCGYLPLAIALLAGAFNSRPAYTLSRLLADLEVSSDRLALLVAEDRTVAAAF